MLVPSLPVQFKLDSQAAPEVGYLSLHHIELDSLERHKTAEYGKLRLSGL